MITKRDQDIFNFLDEFHIATSSQIHKLFFSKTSYPYTCVRLKYLSDEGLIKRAKSTIDNCFAYYVEKKPVQIHHDLIRSELYVSIKEKYNILEWTNEHAIANIRPDAITYVEDHGMVFPVFVEVHVTNKFNFDKYIQLLKENDLKTMYGSPMPRVIICTDRQTTVQNIGIKFKVIGLDMKGLESLFK